MDNPIDIVKWELQARRRLEEAYKETKYWEENLKKHCVSADEQQVIHDVFVRFKDRIELDKLK